MVVVVLGVFDATEASAITIDQPTEIGSIDQSPALETPRAEPVTPEKATGAYRGLNVLNVSMIVATTVVLIIVVRRKWYQLPGTPSGQVNSILIPLLMFGGIFFGQILGVGVASTLLDYSGSDNATLMENVLLRAAMYLAALPFIIGAFVWFFQRPNDELGDDVIKPQPIITAALIGVAGLVMIWPVTQVAAQIGQWINQLISEQKLDPVAHETLNEILQSPDMLAKWWMIALVTIGAPIVEEIMYRGLLQRALQQLFLSKYIGLLLASLIFMIMHIGAVEWYALPVLFLLGVAFGLLYERTGRIIAPIVAHGLFNLLNVMLTVWAAGASG